MEEEPPVIYIPQDGETLGQYLNRFTNEDRQRLCQNESRLVEFSRRLLNTPWRFEIQEERNDQAFEHLWSVLEDVNNYWSFLQLTEMLEDPRQALLESLEKEADEMYTVSKWCTIARIVCCAADSIGTVGGYFLTESNSRYAKLAFSMATTFGFLGFSSTVAELKISRSTFDDLMKQVQRDQVYFSEIQQWCQQSEELERAIENIFPFRITRKILEDFTKTIENEYDPVTFLSRLYSAISDLDNGQLQNERLIRNLIRFASNRSTEMLRDWVRFRRQRPLLYDFAKQYFQCQNSLLLKICRAIPTLARSDDFILSVVGRTAVNFWSMLEGINSLRRPELCNVSCEMRDVRKNLEAELSALRRIANFIRLRRNIQ